MAENKAPNVGLRLRTLREEEGLSLRALAERCGLSITAISRIEQGENSPTVSTLHRLATALEISIADFFREDVKQRTIFIKRDQGMRSQSDNVVMESLGIGLFNQQLEPFRLVIGSNAGNIEDPVSHPGEEFIHCLEGELEYSVGDQLFNLEPGDSLLFAANQLHAYKNITKEPAVILMIFQTHWDRHLVSQLHLENRDRV